MCKQHSFLESKQMPNTAQFSNVVRAGLDAKYIVLIVRAEVGREGERERERFSQNTTRFAVTSSSQVLVTWHI